MRTSLLALILSIALSGLGHADTRVPQTPSDIALSFAPVVREAAPAVVNIYASRVVAQRISPFADDPFFGPLFRDLAPSQPRVQNSLGSGVILSPDGIVVSNTHVVGGMQDIRVVLTDRREFAADILLADEESDITVLRLRDAQDLPALDLRDSDEVEVGELVLAIGNPFGVGQTVTSGIVSGLGSIRGSDRKCARLVHPDRCRDQPGQLGRRTGGRDWQADWHQHVHPHADRCFARYRVCDSLHSRCARGGRGRSGCHTFRAALGGPFGAGSDHRHRPRAGLRAAAGLPDRRPAPGEPLHVGGAGSRGRPSGGRWPAGEHAPGRVVPALGGWHGRRGPSALSPRWRYRGDDHSTRTSPRRSAGPRPLADRLRPKRWPR
jgi:hypothetical protein